MGARLEHLTEKFLGIQEYSFSDVTASFSTFIYSHTHRDTHRQTDIEAVMRVNHWSG